MLGRMDAYGAITYLTYLRGSRDDAIDALTVDAAGNVYAAGWTYSPDFPTSADAYDSVCGTDGTCTIYRFNGSAGRFELMPASDGFVTVIAAAGTRILYSTFIGGSDGDSVSGVAVDASGRIHVTGDTISGDFPVTPGALQTAWAADYNPDDDPLDDAFYARIDRTSLGYGTYLGGFGNDWGTGVVVDPQGDAYVTGNTKTTNFPVKNAPRPANTSTTQYPNESYDGFLARFGAGGAVYSTYVGGSSFDYANDVAVVDGSVLLGGEVCSADFPGLSDPNVTQCAAYVSELDAATGAAGRTVTLHNAGGFDRVNGLAVDSRHRVYITGLTVSITTAAFPTTPDAYQRTTSASSNGGNSDAFFSIVDMGSEAPSLLYSTYLGGVDEDEGAAAAPDGSGGAFFAGSSRTLRSGASSSFPSHTSQPQPPPESPSPVSQAFAAHVSVVPADTGGGASEIVLYARDAAVRAGTWQSVADITAAGGIRLWNPDGATPKLTSAAASPANYFDLTFDAQAGVPYHLWLRMKADNDSWQNDSVFVQFSDSLDPSGRPAWRMNTPGAAVVSLEDCTGCGERGWGWNDNGYGAAGTLVTFERDGRHTIRVQQREDGISIDQVVLSPAAYLTTSPGANRDDTTILGATGAATEVVIYGGDLAPRGGWQVVPDNTAAGGARAWNPDAAVPKIGTPATAPANYVEVTFSAAAGVPYHLWMRMKADGDSWQNDSVFVQFSDSLDSSGRPAWRLDTASATIVSLEDCSGCGEQGWGWNDNGYDTPGTLITFEKSGVHTLRIQQREDGISIDQVVLSAAKYLSQSPGAPKNDTTFVPK